MKYASTKKSAGLLSATLIAFSSTTFALNPVEGWYAGLYLGVSYAPTTTINLTKSFQQVPAGNVSLEYGVLGGVGGEVGYRCGHLRAEGELLYNNNPYSSLSANDSKYDLVINGTRTTLNGTAYPLSMKGQTNIGAVLINGFFDLYTPSRDNVSNVVPYVGLGIGYAYVQNNLQFQNISGLPGGGKIAAADGQFWRSYTSLAGQAIAGVNYFMDDFTTLGIDLRFFSTTNQTHPARYAFTSFNTQAQIYSANLVFNGAFDLG